MTGIEPALSAWESVPFTLDIGSELRFHGFASDREYRLITGVNRTLMARQGATDLTDPRSEPPTAATYGGPTTVTGDLGSVPLAVR
jgi:hypothetical protein